MKCTIKRYLSLCICVTILLCFVGCDSLSTPFPYTPFSEVSTFNVVPNLSSGRALPFAHNLCVVKDENIMNESIDMSTATSAGLFDINECNVLYAKNVHERLHPASLTKIMTAYVALKYGKLDQVLTANSSIHISESGAQLCGLKEGDKLTLDQALHALLIYSANDAALLIADGVGGSVEDFVNLMNQEAAALGATNTHFANPHGLTQESHYTTAYDLYLIFSAAIQNEKFKEIISMKSYDTVYKDKNDNEKNLNFKNTNQFLQGQYSAPENITIIGGKTGTTNAAGHCLIMLARDVHGSPYISVILCSNSRENVYNNMALLLNEINK